MDEENNQQNNQNEERGEAKQKKNGKFASFAVSLGKVIGGIGTPADWINVLKVAIPCFLASFLITIALWSAVIGVFVQPLYEFEKWTSELWGKVEGAWNGLAGGSEYTDKEQDLLSDMERYDIEGRDDTDDHNSTQLDGDVPFESITNYYEDAFGYNHRLNQIYNQYKKPSAEETLNELGIDDVLKFLNGEIMGSALKSILGVLIQDMNPSAFGYDNEIDTSIIQAVLYNNRLGGNLLNQDQINEFYQKSEENKDYQYFAIHGIRFKNERENAYFNQLNSKTPLEATSAIEILAKHMIKYSINIDIYLTKSVYDALKVKSYTGFDRNYMVELSITAHEIPKVEKYDTDLEGNYIIDEAATKEKGETVYKTHLEDAFLPKIDVNTSYVRDCNIFKDYLQGTGVYQGYPQNFIDSYYKQYINESKTRQDMVDQIYDYAYWYQKSTQRYSYCVEEEYIESDADTDFSCEAGGKGATGLCNYDDYTIELYDCGTLATTQTGLSWGEYLSGVVSAEIGKISSGVNTDEVAKAKMIIAKTYAVYHINKGSNGAKVDDASKTISLKACGSGGFQAYKNDDRYASLYPEVQDKLLLNQDGSIFNANYAACKSNNLGIQNILYAFADVNSSSYADSSSLMPPGYESYTYSQILDFIIKQNAVNYKCQSAIYGAAHLGNCPESGYIASVGSSNIWEPNKIYEPEITQNCTIDDSDYDPVIANQIIEEARKIRTISGNIGYTQQKNVLNCVSGNQIIHNATGGFDCSTFVYFVYALHCTPNANPIYDFGINATAANEAIATKSKCVKAENVKPGDVIFFDGNDGRWMDIGHTGIYIGGGMMIDMSSSQNGVTQRPINKGGNIVMYTRPYASAK